MNKSLVIDFKVLEEQDLSVEEFLFLYTKAKKYTISIVHDVIDEEKLEKNLFIKTIDNKIYLRQKTNDLIEFLSLNTEGSFNIKKKKKRSSRIVLSVIDERVDEFRKKWKGLKPGSMGSKKSCKEKLNRWMKENPEYDFDQILNAADLYLNTEGINLRFLQRADYFIYKQDANREENSRLSAYIDDVDDKSSQDWTTKLI